MSIANKVLRNICILYARMAVSMGISLYSTRIVLDALGAKDYGVFNLVGGIIALLAFLNVALTVSTQRYLSFYQAKNDLILQKRIFSNSLYLHLAVGLIVIGALKVLGFFFFNGLLNIPIESETAAKSIYFFMSLSIFFTIATVPFTALLNAHENMTWIAIVGFTEVILKLLVALYIQVIDENKLTTFGLLTSVISLLTFSMYAIICFRRYAECTLRFRENGDRKIRRDMAVFAGWNLFGTLCALGRVQGIAIILNVFFGAIANAAYAIANQVGSQLNFFSATLLQALNPQIMKSEGLSDRERMLRLSMAASKFCFFLLSLFSIPALFEMPAILGLWLKDIPEYTIVFCRLVLIGTLTNQLTIGLQSAVQATGNIKRYQSAVGSVLLLNLPIGYLLLRFGLPPQTILFTFIGIELIACGLRIFFLHKIAALDVKAYLLMLFRLFATVAPSVVISYLIVNTSEGGGRLIWTSLINSTMLLISICFIGLSPSEKLAITGFAKKIYFRLVTSLRLIIPQDKVI